MSVAPLFRPVAFGDLPGWQEDDHDAAFAYLMRIKDDILAEENEPSGSR